MSGSENGLASASSITVVDKDKNIAVPIKYPDATPLTPRPMKDDAVEIEANDFEEEAASLEDVEREMIRKALERHNGKRKYAAQDLKISERTLYRKIKEYNLENL